MDTGVVRVAQFSDLHLVGKPGTSCKGIDTWAQLKKMLSNLSSQEAVDALVLTGDIAHDEQYSTYVQLREILEEYNLPYWVIPGNHDSPEFIREVFWDRVEDNTAVSRCDDPREGRHDKIRNAVEPAVTERERATAISI